MCAQSYAILWYFTSLRCTIEYYQRLCSLSNRLGMQKKPTPFQMISQHQTQPQGLNCSLQKNRIKFGILPSIGKGVGRITKDYVLAIGPMQTSAQRDPMPNQNFIIFSIKRNKYRKCSKYLHYYKEQNSKMGLCTSKFQTCFKFLDKRHFTAPSHHSK